MIALLLLACSTAEYANLDTASEPQTPSPPVVTHHGQFVPLDAPRLLRRMSLDILGRLPTLSELDAVETNPDLLADYRSKYLQSNDFNPRFVNLLGERWHTQIDAFNARVTDFGFDVRDEFRFERSAGDEPLRLMAWVASNDRPWTEILTADYTVANRYLSEILPLEPQITGDEWTVARYTDGRPAAGVLSTTGLWWRYYTTSSNMNRARAAAISDLLLCNDFLSRPVVFSESATLSADESTELAVKTDPQCISCHAALDPLAATLFGFWWNPLESSAELTRYHPEREPLGADWLDVEPAFFGTPVNNLTDVAWEIADDPRFHRCTVETMTTLLWRRDLHTTDFDLVSNLTAAFHDNGMKMHALIQHIMDTPQYQAGGFNDQATAEDRTREHIVRMLSPDQISRAIKDLTGFQWTWRGFNQLENDDLGYRVLGGGIDGEEVFTPQEDASLSWSLLVLRMSQFAAEYAVKKELENDGPRNLFRHVTLESRVDDSAIDDELEHLHWRLFGLRSTQQWRDDIRVLWSEINANSGPAAAWKGVLSAMFSDPEFVSY